MGKTLKEKICFQSKGIHSGNLVTMTLFPLQEGGIVFKHLPSQTTIPLTIEFVQAISLGTNLVKNNVTIKTIEHLCAVLWAQEISDLLVELDGDEVPIVDGSGLVFYEEITKTGTISSQTKRPLLMLDSPMIEFYENDSFLMAFPAEELSVNYTINFPENPIKAQNFIFKGREYFAEDILQARTFGNIEEVEMLHKAGRALGADFTNCLVYNTNNFVVEKRYEDEPVRHKILDLLGDLYASGYNIKAKFIAYKTSHAINNKFVNKLINSLG